jgi:hypothetical protein
MVEAVAATAAEVEVLVEATVEEVVEVVEEDILTGTAIIGAVKDVSFCSSESELRDLFDRQR